MLSRTLGMLLKQLGPSWTIEVVERLDTAALESSGAWTNAGLPIDTRSDLSQVGVELYKALAGGNV